MNTARSKQMQGVVCRVCRMGGQHMDQKTIGGDREVDQLNLSEISEFESLG